MDAIASTSFGIRVDSQKDRNDPFVTNAKAVFENFNTSNPIMFLRGKFVCLGCLGLLCDLKSCQE